MGIKVGVSVHNLWFYFLFPPTRDYSSYGFLVWKPRRMVIFQDATHCDETFDQSSKESTFTIPSLYVNTSLWVSLFFFNILIIGYFSNWCFPLRPVTPSPFWFPFLLVKIFECSTLLPWQWTMRSSVPPFWLKIYIYPRWGPFSPQIFSLITKLHLGLGFFFLRAVSPILLFQQKSEQKLFFFFFRLPKFQVRPHCSLHNWWLVILFPFQSFPCCWICPPPPPQTFEYKNYSKTPFWAFFPSFLCHSVSIAFRSS